MADNGGMNHRAHADLLRQAMLQNSSRRDDDGQDLIGSISTTPSGIATPQPDLSDKRFPGITHSFFAQVRATSDSAADLENQPTSPTISERHGSQSLPQSVPEEDKQDSVSSLSGSAVMLEHGHGPARSASPVAEPRCDSFEELRHADFNPLPTPPHSSSSFCSVMQKDGEEAENGKPDGGVVSIYQTLKNLILPKTSVKNRRHTSHPVSSITHDSVHASHFSNPCLPDPSTSLKSPNDSQNTFKSSEELIKLTDTSAAISRLKNTPPLTPRAMSNELHPADKKAYSTAGSPSRSHPDPRMRNHGVATPASSSSSGGAMPETQGPPVAPLKGKLNVKISDGRGLRPSYDPYVVCVFEWNEYISKGAHVEESHHSESRHRNHFDTLGPVPIQRSNSDSGRAMAIPMKSRQSSQNSIMDSFNYRASTQVTDPHWNHEAVFDVLGDDSEIDVSVYDRSNQEHFLGHVRLRLNLREDKKAVVGWFPLEARAPGDGHVSGEIHLQMFFQKTDKKHFGPNDFQILKLIGKGTFGQVYQVRKKDTQRIYAMKVLSKKVIIQKKEVAHTLGERNILVRTATTDSPFIVGLKFSFQTPSDLYLVTDYMSGGELFWHLQKEGRFQEYRAKFYIAELILALQHLHQHDIVYRDLKPENILLDANGHIALCDFGLSKANLTKNDTTNTFCGTTEYLAPEVLMDEQGYTKMVDFWSLGVLVFEMCCGWSPFYADDTQQMYKNIAFGKVRFPRDALSAEGRNFVKGLLNRNPKHRLGARDDARELMAHPFFHDVDWHAMCQKNVIPPFKPKLKSVSDTSYFDPEFTTALDHSASLNARAAALAAGAATESTPLSPATQANFKGFTFVNESTMEQHLGDRHVDYMDEDFREDDSWVNRARPGDLDYEHRMNAASKASHDEGGIFNDDYHFEM
ncbi:Serine/threonine-protein kinase [Ophidiomyces ophidiicola]|nr:Serine/threonine-protein kinase [Ophidiomyces ophidiicola]KAI2140230.1 Serine/threonine-protein kinase [Ophidiomyces ophidiicola]KAI2142177.1 Serine/threonine-protein kinase [Ophidiomyces ophidiicola]KAI2215698.1 Serine/threonine-protein kinase [Ophidiomyces ophidiicola]KAI2352201.1 Serine/threonine-protein kinase [Ophidiomyces ophidiicola]